MRKTKVQNETVPTSGRRSSSSQRQNVTLYDAVAGRAGYEGFLSSTTKPSRNRDTSSTTQTAVPPEEILFRSEGAPIRYEEDDIYFQDRHLDPRNALQRLPDSDLLKALHAYASDFYAATADGRGCESFESLDETALLALGILVEEAGRHIFTDDEVESESESGSDADSTSESSGSSSEQAESKAEPTGSAQTSQTMGGGTKIESQTNAGTSQSTVSGGVGLPGGSSSQPHRRNFEGDVKMEGAD